MPRRVAIALRANGKVVEAYIHDKCPRRIGNEWAGQHYTPGRVAKRCLAVFRPVQNNSQEIRTALCAQAQHSDVDTAVGTSVCGLGGHRRARLTYPFPHMLARMCRPQR